MQKFKVTDKCTKKVRRQIEYLGWPLKEPTYYEAFRYLMEERGEYVHPIPLVQHEWEVGVVILGRPNKKDGLLNRCSVKENLKSYDDAVRVGGEFIIERHAHAKREISKRMLQSDFDEWCEEHKKNMEEEGFDFD